MRCKMVPKGLHRKQMSRRVSPMAAKNKVGEWIAFETSGTHCPPKKVHYHELKVWSPGGSAVDR